MMTWTIQQAEERFEEMIEAALTNGPQAFTRDGREVAIMLPMADYLSLTAPKRDLGA
jgi:prevent-host-death family protein